MRSLLLPLIINALFRLSVAQTCPGICQEDETLENPASVVTLPGGILQFCGVVDNQSKGIIDQPDECTSKAQAAQNGGCICTGPPSATSSSPSINGATTSPTVTPVPTQVPSTPPSMEAVDAVDVVCPGICLDEEATLENPTGVAVLPGAIIQFCAVLDNESKSIVGDADLCNSKGLLAQNSGCICLGPPTTMPSSSPSTSPKPSATPTGVPTMTPTGSPAPTVTDAPTKVPTTPSPTTTPRAPGLCIGVCYSADEMLFNPSAIAIIRNPSTNAVTDIELCGNLDNRYKTVFTDPNTCDTFAFYAQRAGCSCGLPVECPGICSTEGEVVVNPNELVTVDGAENSCGGFDAEWDAIKDPSLCNDVPGKIDSAIAAGCKCAVPVDCSGMCPNDGDQVTTPDLLVSLSDGTVATCADLDTTFSAILDKDRCDETPALIAEAKSAGCKCGVPVPCPGICTDANDQVTTPNQIVSLPDGISASCTALDLQLKAVIDPETCVARLDEYLAAGCKCGIPFNCPGICLNPNNDKIFDKNVEVNDPSTGVLDKCGDIDKNNRDIIDEEICRDRGFEAVQAGCQCGDTTPSPTAAPTLTPVPTSSSPSSAPTFNTLRPPVQSGPTTSTAPTGPTSGLNSAAHQKISTLLSVVVSVVAFSAAAFILL